MHILQISNLLWPAILQWMQLVILFGKYQIARHKQKLHLRKPHLLICVLAGYRANETTRDVWNLLQTNWNHFYWLTGETPNTLSRLVNDLQREYDPYINRGRPSLLDFKNQVLVTMIWLRRYPCMIDLAIHFSIPVSCIHRILHKCVKLLHAFLVPRYTHWHTMPEWRNLAGTYPEWPRVVAIVDGTPFRISKLTGPIQRIYYRGDRHCFFLNWIVIIDVRGKIVLSKAGFLGRTSDTTCMWYINLPVLPQGLKIMADQGFEHQHPIIVLPHRNQPQIPRIMRRTFRRRRSLIERCFGILKNSYSSMSSKRYRSRHWTGPVICNISTALFNRRQEIFKNIRPNTGLRYM